MRFRSVYAAVIALAFFSQACGDSSLSSHTAPPTILLAVEPVDGSRQVLASSNGGATWSTILTYEGDASLSAIPQVDFVDQQHGWALLARRALFRTTDGGRSWEEQAARLPPSNLDPSPAAIWLAALAQQDAIVLEVFQDAPRLLTVMSVATGDGGATWGDRAVVGGYAANIGNREPFVCAEADLAFVLSRDDGSVTADGGSSWARVRDHRYAEFGPGSAFARAVSVACGAPSTLWVFGGRQALFPPPSGDDPTDPWVLVSRDAGRSWTNLPILLPEGEGLRFGRSATSGPDRVWVAFSSSAELPRLLHSRDGGRSWSEQRLPLEPDPTNQTFVVSMTFVGDDGLVITSTRAPVGRTVQVLTTANGGETWDIAAYPDDILRVRSITADLVPAPLP